MPPADPFAAVSPGHTSAVPADTPDLRPPTGTMVQTGESSGDVSVYPTVPGFEIYRELGRGGLGVVYEARHAALGRKVALKMILGGGIVSAAAKARFLAEAQAVAAVRHPGIVQVYDFGHADGQPYFALEFCPGGSL